MKQVYRDVDLGMRQSPGNGAEEQHRPGGDLSPPSGVLSNSCSLQQTHEMLY